MIVIRKTRQKEAILRVLKENSTHPTASWIYEQVRQEMPHISLGTVYRDLKTLKKEGAIAELEFAGSLNRFDGNTQRHYHFHCQKCDRIFDIAEPVDAEIDKRIAQRNNCEVFYHRLEFYGLCRDCCSKRKNTA
jgi:Fur family peroxide stress response transcriptional regulator